MVVDDSLYVRAYNGQGSRWYQAAVRQKAGRITAAGMTKEVAFEPVDGPINDRIDEAYRVKYGGSPYLDFMIGSRARSATVEVIPRPRGTPRDRPAADSPGGHGPAVGERPVQRPGRDRAPGRT